MYTRVVVGPRATTVETMEHWLRDQPHTYGKVEAYSNEKRVLRGLPT